MTMFKKVRMRMRKQANNLWKWHRVATYSDDNRIVLCPISSDSALEIVPAAGMEAVIVHDIDKEGLKHDGQLIDTDTSAMIRIVRFLDEALGYANEGG